MHYFILKTWIIQYWVYDRTHWHESGTYCVFTWYVWITMLQKMFLAWSGTEEAFLIPKTLSKTLLVFFLFLHNAQGRKLIFLLVMVSTIYNLTNEISPILWCSSEMLFPVCYSNCQETKSIKENTLSKSCNITEKMQKDSMYKWNSWITLSTVLFFYSPLIEN